MGSRFATTAFTFGAITGYRTSVGSLIQPCRGSVSAFGGQLAVGRLVSHSMAAATSPAAAVDKLDAAVAAITTENLRRWQNRANGCKPNSTSQNVADRSWEEQVQFLRVTYSLYSTWQFQNGSNFSRRKYPPPLYGWTVCYMDGLSAWVSGR